MNDDRSRINVKSIITVAIAVVLFAIGCILIFGSDLLNNKKPETNNSDVDSGNLPDLESVRTTEYFYSIDEDDPFRYLPDFKNFSCVIDVFDYYIHTSSVRYKVSSYENKFRIENNDILKICDGEKLYIETPTYCITTDSEHFDLCEEAGIILFSELKSKIEENESEITISDDKKKIEVFIYDKENDVTEEYSVSTQNGAVISCDISNGSRLIKSYVLSDISVLNDRTVDEHIFDIDD